MKRCMRKQENTFYHSTIVSLVPRQDRRQCPLGVSAAVPACASAQAPRSRCLYPHHIYCSMHYILFHTLHIMYRSTCHITFSHAPAHKLLVPLHVCLIRMPYMYALYVSKHYTPTHPPPTHHTPNDHPTHKVGKKKHRDAHPGQ